MDRISEMATSLYNEYLADLAKQWNDDKVLERMILKYRKDNDRCMVEWPKDGISYTFDEWLEHRYEMEESFLKDMSDEQRCTEYLTDDNYAELNKCSWDLYRLAQKKHDKTNFFRKKVLSQKELDQADHCIERILELKDQVKEFNQYVTERDVSEALVDYNFITTNSKCYSMRMNSYVRY